MPNRSEQSPESLPGLIERIEQRRRDLGFPSDQALCRAAGLDPDYIRATIRRNKEPGAAKLLALARALDCSISYLVTGEEPAGEPFDEARMLDVVRAVAEFAGFRGSALKPAEFAELVVHLYHIEVEANGDGSLARRLLNERR